MVVWATTSSPGMRSNSVEILPIQSNGSVPGATAFPGSAMVPATAPYEKIPSPWKLVFDSEFSGNSIDTNKWGTYCFPFKSCNGDQALTQKPPSWFEQEIYNGNNCIVKNGQLDMVATAGTGNPRNPYYSCQITTASKTYGTYNFWFTYGLMEARMWVARGPDTWVGFWTAAVTNHWPPELDIVETYGSVLNMYYHDSSDTLHYMQNGVKKTCTMEVPGSQVITQGWHTFAADWEPGRITWYLDARRVFQCTGSIVPSDRQYLLLNMNLDLFMRNPPITAVSPADAQQEYTTKVSYVRVYQHPGVGVSGPGEHGQQVTAAMNLPLAKLFK